MLQMINISPDRSVYPSRIKVGNRFENGVEKIQFNIPKDISKRGYEYLILNKGLNSSNNSSVFIFNNASFC